jgi:hypothetical protein
MPQDPFAPYVVAPAADPFAPFVVGGAPQGWKPVAEPSVWKPVTEAHAAVVAEAPAPESGGFIDSAKRFVTSLGHGLDPRPALSLLYDVSQMMPGGSLEDKAAASQRTLA